MKINLRYFASIREGLGLDVELVEAAGPDVAALLTQLRARGGAYVEVLSEGRPVRAAVNQIMARPDTPLSDGAEVGLFPPVTGG